MSSTEKIVTGVALFISLLALYVSIRQTQIMSDQRSASVWPYVEYGSSFGPNRYEIEVENSGVGPAKIREVYYETQDSTFTAIHELVNYVAEKKGWSFVYEYANIENGLEVLTPGYSRRIFFVESDSTDMIGEISDYFNDIDIYLEYCSIYDDCWINHKGSIKEK